MTLRTLFGLIRRYLVSALIIAALAGAAAGALSLLRNSPDHVASATISLRLTQDGSSGPVTEATVVSLTASAPALFRSPSVLQPAGESLTPPMTGEALFKRIDFRAPTSSLIFTALLTDPDGARAEDALKAVTAEFTREVEAGALTGPGGVRLEIASVDLRAEVAPGSSLGASGVAMVALAVGGLVGLTYLLVRVLLDNKIRTTSDIEELTDDAVVAHLAGGTNSEVPQLARNFTFLAPNPDARVVALSGLTSSDEAAALAPMLVAALSAQGDTAIAVDLDLEGRPLGDGPGAAEYLVDPGAALVPHGALLPAGGPVPNPLDLLGRPSLGTLLERLAEEYRWVVVVAGPLLPSSAGAMTMLAADWSLMVVEAGRDTRGQLREGLDVLELAGVSPAGIVLRD